MKIINALWEKRNLGMDCIEISIEHGDDADVFDTIGSQQAGYQVLKIPSDVEMPIVRFQEMGFVYAEDLIDVAHDLHTTVRSKMHQRLYDASAYRLMSDEDYDLLITEVQNGMFSTDRIARDPAFGPEISARRYTNWLRDLREQQAWFYLITYKSDPCGFIVLQVCEKGIFRSVLGGGYEKYRNSGLGIIQKEQEIVKSLGGRSVVTSVSSNNPGQLKALVINGYVPIRINHVFIRHL